MDPDVARLALLLIITIVVALRASSVVKVETAPLGLIGDIPVINHSLTIEVGTPWAGRINYDFILYTDMEKSIHCCFHPDIEHADHDTKNAIMSASHRCTSILEGIMADESSMAMTAVKFVNRFSDDGYRIYAKVS